MGVVCVCVCVWIGSVCCKVFFGWRNVYTGTRLDTWRRDMLEEEIGEMVMVRMWG